MLLIRDWQSRGLAQGYSSVFSGVCPALFCSSSAYISLQIGMGLGGPIGGIIADRYNAVSVS
jgi:hypothetical protein